MSLYYRLCPKSAVYVLRVQFMSLYYSLCPKVQFISSENSLCPYIIVYVQKYSLCLQSNVYVLRVQFMSTRVQFISTEYCSCPKCPNSTVYVFKDMFTVLFPRVQFMSSECSSCHQSTVYFH